MFVQLENEEIFIMMMQNKYEVEMLINAYLNLKIIFGISGNIRPNAMEMLSIFSFMNPDKGEGINKQK